MVVTIRRRRARDLQDDAGRFAAVLVLTFAEIEDLVGVALHEDGVASPVLRDSLHQASRLRERFPL